MITTSDRLVVSMIVERTAGSSAVRGSDSRASHVSVVTWAVVTGTGSKSSVASGRSGGDSSDFRVTELVVALLSLPELIARAASVVVSRARTETLLLLVVTAQDELHRDGQEEEEASAGQHNVLKG